MSDQAAGMGRAGADTAEIGALAVTAGGLLLNEPDARLREALKGAGYAVADEKGLRRLFYDRLGIPQSGLYLPPYEHVFRKRERVEGKLWYFPPARHDGALGVEGFCRAWGFDRTRVPASPLFRGRHIPGDHLGFMLVFAGTALQRLAEEREQNAEFATSLRGFVEEHLDGWVDAFCELLPLGDAGGYLKAIADATQEAAGLLRYWCSQDGRRPGGRSEGHPGIGDAAQRRQPGTSKGPSCALRSHARRPGPV